MFRKGLIFLTFLLCSVVEAAPELVLPKTYPVLYVDFVQERVIEGLKKPITSKGIMILAEKEGIYWHQKTPFNMTMLLTQSKMTNQVEDGPKEVITAKNNPLLFQFNHLLSALFTMDVNQIEKFFQITNIQTFADRQEITLKPITAPVDKIFRSISLVINDNITAVTLIDMQGDVTRLSFSDHLGMPTFKGQDAQLFK